MILSYTQPTYTDSYRDPQITSSQNMNLSMSTTMSLAQS